MSNACPYPPVAITPQNIQALDITVTNLVLLAGDQQLIPANTRRHRLILVNQSLANLANFTLNGAAAAANQGLTLGFIAAAGGGDHIWDSAGGLCTASSIRVNGIAGQSVTAIEFSQVS